MPRSRSAVLVIICLVTVLTGCRSVSIEKAYRLYFNKGIEPARRQVTAASRAFPETLRVGWLGYIEGKEITVLRDNCFVSLATQVDHNISLPERNFQLARIWGMVGIPIAFPLQDGTLINYTTPSRQGYRYMLKLSAIYDQQSLNETEFPRHADAQHGPCVEKLNDQKRKWFIVTETWSGTVVEAYWEKKKIEDAWQPGKLEIQPKSTAQPSSPRSYLPNNAVPHSPGSAETNHAASVGPLVSALWVGREVQQSEQKASQVPTTPNTNEQDPLRDSFWKRYAEEQNKFYLASKRALAFRAKWIRFGSKTKVKTQQGKPIRQIALGDYCKLPPVDLRIQ